MFDKLFEPLLVGTITLKNRLVMTPMSSKLCDAEHRATPQAAAYYAARAAGGFGLIETGYLSVRHDSIPDDHQGCIYDDSFVPGLALVAKAVHEAAPDAKIFAQLVHTGNQADTSLTGEPAVGASTIPALNKLEPVHELTTEEVWDLIDDFADAAVRAQRAGFDGVEVHAAHGYLLTQFLSKRFNRRVDEFGGGTVERARIVCEIVRAIKESCGDAFPVSVRFNATDDQDDGNDLSDYAAQALEFERAGANMLNVSVGTIESGTIIQSNYTRPGFNSENARVIRAAAHVPVCVVGRVNDPAVAERIVASGAADLVGMGRQTIADPQFPNKVREGRLDELVACTGCMQRCIGMPTCGPEDVGLSCMLNPFSGKEALSEWQATPVTADGRRRVVVVGAGLAGLMAARVAAQRGHDVTVLEKAATPGGQYRLASMPPAKHELARTIRSFEVLAELAGANMRYGVEATEQTIADLQPDAVILSTGAQPIWPPIPGIEGPRVVKANDVLRGQVAIGHERVLVVGAGLVGCETADYLTPFDNRITIVDMVSEMAGLLNPVPRAKLLERFDDYGVAFLGDRKVLEFTEDGVRVQQVVRVDDPSAPRGVRFEDVGEPEELAGFDHVVVAMGARSFNPLEEAVSASGVEVHVVGDARQAGDAKRGIYDAARVALAL